MFSSMKDAQTEPTLQQIAAMFFRDRTEILQKPSGDPMKDRLCAMRDILAFIKHCAAEYCSHEMDRDSLEVSQGKIDYCYADEPSTCYDGGCYSDWSTTYDVYSKIMEDKELSAAKREAKTDGLSHFTQCYLNDHPECSEGTAMFVDRNNIYLIRPFGTTVNLRFWEEIHV